MEHTKLLKETVDRFVATIDKINNAVSLDMVSDLELEAVRTLQLAEAEVGEAARDLYIAVMTRKGDIREGKVAIKKEVAPKTEQKPNKTEQKPNKKKAAKKASK